MKLRDEGTLRGPTIVAAAVVVYALFAGSGWLWMWLRDRAFRVPMAGAGDVGLPASMGIGIGIGLLLSGLFALLSRYWPPFARLEGRLAELIGPLGENEIIVLALCSSVGEEFFFRLAAQDALGLWPAAIAFGLLNIGPGGLALWSVLAFALGVGFGWMMELGCGLLSVTAAHAVINYLSLHRMSRR